jgi:hypothetical protein
MGGPSGDGTESSRHSRDKRRRMDGLWPDGSVAETRLVAGNPDAGPFDFCSGPLSLASLGLVGSDGAQARRHRPSGSPHRHDPGQVHHLRGCAATVDTFPGR